MQLQGKIVAILPLQTGNGKNGEWKKQDIIVETNDQYPKKICVSIWGDKIVESIIKEGNNLDISFDIESREFNGRWYTDIKAWRLELANKTGANVVSKIIPPEVPEYDEEKDLPF